MQSRARWLPQSLMTELGALPPVLIRLPSDVALLNRVVHGLLLHCEWLGKYDNDPDAFGPISRSTFPVKERLARLLEHDARELDEARMPTRERLAPVGISP